MSTKRSTKSGNTLRVGITGHRPNRMPERYWERVKKDLAQVMARVEEENPDRRPMLLSGLAEGADRLAAFVSLGRGWSLGAVLAFHRTRFEADFPEPFAVGEFRALLAASETVEEPKKAAQVRRPEDGYDAVGRRLVALSDVLIAVWDGEGSRGKGGTVDVIELAHARGMPVIWVHARKAQPPRRLRAPDGAREMKRSNVRSSRTPAA